MFFASADRIRAMRELIGAAELARERSEEGGEENGEAGGKAAAARAAAEASALSALKSYQVEDFAGIFREMKGAPVVIRTLDPPLHEFMPSDGPALSALVQNLSKLLAVSREVRELGREREGERAFFLGAKTSNFSGKLHTKKVLFSFSLSFLPSLLPSLVKNKQKRNTQAVYKKIKALHEANPVS